MSKKHSSVLITLKPRYPFVNVRIVKDDKHNQGPYGIVINWVLWFWMGLFLFVVSIICEKFHEHFKGFEYLFSLAGQFLREFSIAVVIAALIAKMIEVPNLINFVNERTIESLSDYRFLSGLSPIELDSIKKDCSKIIFEKKGKKTGSQFLNESLVEYESNISNLLLQPYHEYYKVNIVCKDVVLKDNMGNQVKFMEKVTKRDFKIINPLIGSTHVNLVSAINLHCPENFKCDDLMKLTKVAVMVDDSIEKIDITSKFSKDITQNIVKHPNYNSRVNYYFAPNNDSRYSFNSEIIVEIVETRYIAHSDPIYVHRGKPANQEFLDSLYLRQSQCDT
jgi:hypothetical protein